MKPRVYVETSVLSYLAPRSSRNPVAVGRQLIATQVWGSSRWIAAPFHPLNWLHAQSFTMSKPYHEMTPAERLTDRIAKNREIDQRVGDKKPAAAPKRKSGEAAPRAKSANNVLDKFQEIKRTQGIDAASEFVLARRK